MTSRNETPGVDDAILDAARRCVLTYGVRRTTLSAVAREAGVSRPTVYRRSPDVAGLVGDVVTREVTSMLPVPSADGDRTHAIDDVLRIVAALRGNELLTAILSHDPELLATYTSQRLGQSQRAVLHVLQATIAAAQRTGSVRAGDPQALAAVVLLLAQSAVFSHTTVADVLPATALDEELRIALDGYLRP